MQLRTCHTAELRTAELGELRRLLDAAYGARFTDADWDHALGGLHTLVLEQGELVGHVSVVQRRRRGYAAAAMHEAEQAIDRAYDLGALSDGTGIDGFYQRRGWRTWTGPTFVVGPDGPRWTPDEDGGVLVRPTPTSPALDLSAPLGCDWRVGDVW